jgi:hypothetical protein
VITPARPAARSTHRSPTRSVPLYVIIASIAAVVLVIGQFAMIALVPVLVTTIAAFVDPRLGWLRWWALALITAYGIPLAIYTLRDDPAPSLSKDLHPVAFVIVVAVALATTIRIGAAVVAARSARIAQSGRAN